MKEDIMEELFDRYISMQDVHRETVENNISMLKNGKSFLTDVEVLRIERDLFFKEIKSYFDNIFSEESKINLENKIYLEEMVEKLKFIIEREDDLEEVLTEYKKLLSTRLGKMRQGKNALNAYGKAWANN
ncbi:MAG: hypothetical protein RBR53_10680 [Desulforegulaceae bacterium]|nr:hypothetical protein [Desulforegulaceae bacterium]